MRQSIEIGRLLRSGIAGFVAGCRVSVAEVPSFGAMVSSPLAPDVSVYGLIHDIRIEDDGLVRQLVTSEGVSDEVMRDNRERRIVPVEMSVVVIGWEHQGAIRHQLPPRPPLSLDRVFPCDPETIRRFTGDQRFGYFRHLLRVPDLPLGELLAAHIQQAGSAHHDRAAWTSAAVREIIVLLRDDYPLLTSVLGSLDGTLGEVS
ncbi:MAG TPA: hypothetical protein VFH29_05105 [Anaerolineales bacterium]|nr:hypothetical protein [Anaerolineales bacterium]